MSQGDEVTGEQKSVGHWIETHGGERPPSQGHFWWIAGWGAEWQGAEGRQPETQENKCELFFLK